MKKMAILPKYFNIHIMQIQRDFYLQQLIDGKQKFRSYRISLESSSFVLNKIP